MNLSDFTLFVVSFGGCVAIASIVMYLAGHVGSPRRGERPGTDFYTSPAPGDTIPFAPPNLTDITPYIQPHDVAGTVDPRR